MNSDDAKRASKDAVVGALADDLRRVGAEPATRKIEDYVVPILEKADRQAEASPAPPAQDAAQPDDPVGDKIRDFEKRGYKWIETDDVGQVHLNTRDGQSFTIDEALDKLAGTRGLKAEAVRRRVWLKYLRETHPHIWSEFVAVMNESLTPQARERRLNDALERSKRLIPVNPWAPPEKKIVLA